MTSIPYRGKLPPDVLRKKVLSKLPVDSSVLLGPEVGEDAAIVDLGEGLLVTHPDPVTGGGNLAGYLSIFVATNDVATRGVMPKWVVSVILLREGATYEELDLIVDQIVEASGEVGVSVVGGHTEVTTGLTFNIVVTTAFGYARKGEKILSTRDARPGDLIVMTKAVALEGTAILASELAGELTDEVVNKASSFIREISVVREAMIARDLANAMHDPTEGGLLGGVQEMAMSSGNGFVIHEESVPIRRETEILCRSLGVDPLRLISSGSLLISVPPDRAEELVRRLRKSGIEASIIGRFTEEPDMVVIRRGGRKEVLEEPVEDELWRFI